MIFAKSRLVLFVLPSTNRSTCLTDYLLECVYSAHAYIMFTEWSCLQDICQREHYYVFLIFNNVVI